MDRTAPVKTPTLRNVGLRTRFFHDGRVGGGGLSLNTLADIVDFYDIDQDPLNGGAGPPFELVGAFGPNPRPGVRPPDAVFADRPLQQQSLEASNRGGARRLAAPDDRRRAGALRQAGLPSAIRAVKLALRPCRPLTPRVRGPTGCG